MSKRLAKTDYIYFNILWFSVVISIYRAFCFNSVSINAFNIYLSNRVSKFIFYSLVVALTLVNVFININQRKVANVFFNSLYPILIYSIISNFDYYASIIIGLLVVVAGGVAFICLLKGLFKPNKHFNIPLMLKRIFVKIRRSKFISNYGKLLMILILIIVPLTNHSVNAVSNVDSNVFDIDEHIDELCDFKEDLWDNYDIDNRFDAFKNAVDIELKYLGVNYNVKVTLDNLGEQINGSYNDYNHLISIDKEYLKNCSNREALELVCHECYHCYQHALLESYDNIDNNYKSLMIFRDVETYRYEFLNYNELSQNFFSYYDLETERDARERAKDRADYYLFLIGEESRNAIVIG